MSETTTSTELAFRPWNLDKPEETALKDVLARVHAERGHFRDITEASLQEEIAAEGGLELSSSDDEDEEQDEAGAGSTRRKAPTTREELFAARQEMNKHINDALQDVLMARDFISLLESKHAPSQATVTMSPALKKEQGIPPGSLGTDIWDPNRKFDADEASRRTTRQAQDDLLASKVRMDGLEKSADALLAAATRFQDNVRKETVFWDQVLNISERGWNVSKLYKHLLGVHIGFSDNPADSARGVAALYSDGEGNIALERSIGTKPKAVRVRVRKGDRVVGCSKLPSLPDQDEAALDARIRHARDSVYDEELFHEMVRETRSLTSMGVTMKGSSIGFATGTDDSLRVEFDLVPLGEHNSRDDNASHESDILAEAALLTARLLLGQEHRKKIEMKKGLPLPMGEKKTDDDRRVSILRPLMFLSRHHSEVARLNVYLQDMSKLLRTAKAEAESQPARIALATSNNGSVDVESLIGSLMRPIASEGVLWIVVSEESTLEFKLQIETSAANALGSTFKLQTPTGVRSEFPSTQDLFEAADEFIGIALGEVLKATLGEGWEVDTKEGSIHKTSDEDLKARLWFSVHSMDKAITLHCGGERGHKEIVWTLDGTGETRGIGDVWKELFN